VHTVGFYCTDYKYILCICWYE